MSHIDTHEMSSAGPPLRPINWAKLRTDEAERVIRDRARATKNILIGEHAFDRVEERSITQNDVYTILRTGHVSGHAQRNIHGDWEVVVTKRMPGTREAGVVVIVFMEREKLFVKTVEWMDWGR